VTQEVFLVSGHHHITLHVMPDGDQPGTGFRSAVIRVTGRVGVALAALATAAGIAAGTWNLVLT